MIEAIEVFSDYKASLEEKVKEYIKDKSIPLDTRLKTARLAAKAELLPLAKYVCGANSIELLAREPIWWYESFYADKYSTVIWLEDEEWFDVFKPSGYVPEKYDTSVILKEGLTVDDVKEAVLDTGLRGFINNW